MSSKYSTLIARLRRELVERRVAASSSRRSRCRAASSRSAGRRSAFRRAVLCPAAPAHAVSEPRQRQQRAHRRQLCASSCRRVRPAGLGLRLPRVDDEGRVGPTSETVTSAPIAGTSPPASAFWWKTGTSPAGVSTTNSVATPMYAVSRDDAGDRVLASLAECDLLGPHPDRDRPCRTPSVSARTTVPSSSRTVPLPSTAPRGGSTYRESPPRMPSVDVRRARPASRAARSGPDS